MYQLRFKDNSRPVFPITGNVCTLGCAKDNTLVLNTSTVDDSHARLIQHDGRLFLQDNKSRRGSFVNGKKVKYKELNHGDVVSIGNVHFDILEAEDNNLTSTRIPAAVAQQRSAVHVAATWRLVSDSSWLSGKVFELAGDSTLLGRGKDCDIVIPGNHLSRSHALLLKQGGKLILKDLDSANGSYVNESRINGELVIKPGDRLRFDVYSFRVQGPLSADTGTNRTSETSGPRKLINLESTLQNIEALKSQEYQQKEWITKPTSHGNRYHEVPTNKNHLGPMFWVSVVLGVGVLGVLGYIVFNI